METNTFANRVMRVLQFDTPVYREVAADQNAMGQAAVVVIVAAILNAIGLAGLGFSVVLVSVVASLVGFAVYAAVAAGVSRSLFQGRTNFQEMGRTLGFAYAWYSLGILGLIPVVGGILALLGLLAAIIAGVVALRESSEFDTTKAVITVVIAGIAAFFINLCATGPLLGMLGLSGPS
ncbi:MAG: YIP1 family protein [Anaerolineales bacterium]